MSRPDLDREEVRDQEPVLVLDGELVWEIWFWHVPSRRWFVMSWYVDPRMLQQGVCYFSPNDVPEALRARVASMERGAA